MQVTETSADGLKREFKIVVPAGELETQISDRITQLGRQIRLPGFRPGKVPPQLLRQRYGSAIRGEVLQETIQDSSAEAIRERNLRPALQPRIDQVSADEGADLEYTMSLEVLPDLPQPDFGALGLEKLVVEVPDDDVDKAVARMAEQFRRAEPVEREAKTGDLVVVDFVGKIDDVEFPGGKGENVTLELGSGQFVPGFEDQLVGAKPGEQRDVRVTFPADYGGADLAGKDAVFAVTVKEVRERQAPLEGDALATEVGLESIGELRQEMRDRIGRDYAMITRQRLKRALLDKLAAQYDFPVPPGMVEIEFANIWQQHEAEKAYSTAAQKTPGDAAQEEAAPVEASADAPAEAAAEPVPETPPAPAEDDEKLKAEYQRLAERRVRLGLLLAEVGRSANISVSQDELNQAVIREAQRFPGSERRVLDYYRKNPEAAGNLRAPIFEEKVVDYIVELAKPEERKVSPQQLLAMSEPEDGEAAEAEPAVSEKPQRQTGARRTARAPKGAEE